MIKTEQSVVTSCSFCLRPRTEVTTLVAGLGVYICNDCVTLCQSAIENKPSTVPQIAPWEWNTDVEEVLSTLPRVAATTAQVEANLAGWVHRARELGATWSRVGEALGMTRQSAWERFSGEE